MEGNNSTPTPEPQPKPETEHIHNLNASSAQSNPPTQPEKPKRKLPLAKLLVAGIVILITVFAFGLIAYLMMGQNKTQENQVAETQVKAPSPTPDPTAEWEIYEGDGFSFKYPSELTLENIANENKSYNFYITLTNNVTGNKYYSVTASSEALPKGTDLEAYINNEKYVEVGGESMKIFDAVKPYSSGSIRGLYYFGGLEYMGYHIFFEKDGTVYKFTLNEEEAGIFEEPEKLEPNILDQILSTFKFTDQANSADETTVDTSGWKTYTNVKRDYSFKYPPEYKITEKEASGEKFEYVSVSKDTIYTDGGGYADSDVLQKGVEIYFLIFPKKDISESELKSEYGSETTVSTIDIGATQFTKVSDPSIGLAEYYYKYKLSPEVLNISTMFGFENESNEKYINVFNQILSTFQFTN